MKNNYVIIMAGGIGSRFWPMSRENFPKQFHDVLGIGKTLIQLTVDRYKNLCPKENIYIVSNIIYKDIIETQLPFLNSNQIILEPCKRNTAPCIAYASAKINKLNVAAKIVVAPSDHLILKQDEFETTIKTAFKQIDLGDYLTTIGILPSRPDTGYGYIKINDSFSGVNNNVKAVAQFTEKPSLEKAKEFVKSGSYYWNSGMFIWSVSSIMKAFKSHTPDLYNKFNKIKEHLNTSDEARVLDEIYPQCEDISIDYAIMEKADNKLVILADFSWSDLGTWGSLYNHLHKDNNNNAIVGDKVFTYSSNNNIIMMPKDKLVVIQGLYNYIVVESDDTLLICEKDNEQQIKQMVQDINSK